MKKNYFLLVIVLLLFVISCSLKVSTSDDAVYTRTDKVYEDTLFFMPIETQNLQIVYDEDTGKLLVVTYITLDRSQMEDITKFCFILDEDTRIINFTINNKVSEIERMLSYSSENIKQKIDHSTLSKIRFTSEIHRFTIPGNLEKDEKIELMIKYSISDQSKGEAYHQTKNEFKLIGDLFWYPQTLVNGGELKLNFNVIADYSITINEKPVNFKKYRSYKFYEHTMQNLFNAPLSIEGKKPTK
ncbi:MAG: hypothetical protein B6226_03955 [Candidatus Cloacimonetes bacterium 4572_65]|nr:MAG: hypothetical protein B6226_03955 [Candidatus Cloacimonetes bacterium 4572_65]